jgi:hypothetical protein
MGAGSIGACRRKVVELVEINREATRRSSIVSLQ